ncbi:MAG: hypothetical protein ABIR81_11625, partial [Ginsengibacter sp.]
MKKIILPSVIGLVFLLVLIVFGKTAKERSYTAIPKSDKPAFAITGHLNAEKSKLSATQALAISKLENSISRGDVIAQQMKVYYQLADFWKDSAKSFPGYAYYTAEASKLVNSEKTLTFAARLFLGRLKHESDESLKIWESESAVDLFEKALQLNPNNDSLKVDLGSCYVYGKGMIGDAAETMKGIQKLLEVVRKDSSNMEAQMVLGVGGVISRQFDKGLERLNKVVKAEPGNLEAVSWLADGYAAKGDNVNAVK